MHRQETINNIARNTEISPWHIDHRCEIKSRCSDVSMFIGAVDLQTNCSVECPTSDESFESVPWTPLLPADADQSPPPPLILRGPVTQTALSRLTPLRRHFTEDVSPPPAESCQVADHPPTELCRRVEDHPPAESRRQVADRPSTESCRQVADHPPTKLCRRVEDHPPAESRRQVADRPSTESCRQVADHPPTEPCRRVADRVSRQRAFDSGTWAEKNERCAATNGPASKPEPRPSAVAEPPRCVESNCTCSRGAVRDGVAASRGFTNLVDAPRLRRRSRRERSSVSRTTNDERVEPNGKRPRSPPAVTPERRPSRTAEASPMPSRTRADGQRRSAKARPPRDYISPWSVYREKSPEYPSGRNSVHVRDTPQPRPPTRADAVRVRRTPQPRPPTRPDAVRVRRTSPPRADQVTTVPWTMTAPSPDDTYEQFVERRDQWKAFTVAETRAAEYRCSVGADECDRPAWDATSPSDASRWWSYPAAARKRPRDEEGFVEYRRLIKYEEPELGTVSYCEVYARGYTGRMADETRVTYSGVPGPYAQRRRRRQ